MRRRDFCKIAGAVTSVGYASDGLALQESLPTIRSVTNGPKFHWRGYYDKQLFDADDRFLLANEVEFEGRTPEESDRIRVGMVDLNQGDEWIELGTSVAWNWQQGCMLQWLPASPRINDQYVLWNDREGDAFVCRILSLSSRKIIRTLPKPIYCVSPNGTWGLSVDFRRLNDCRPGYGYTGIPDPHANELAPEQTGLWRVDLQTGESKFLMSYAQIAAMEYQSDVKLKYDPKKSKHWFNHLLISPDGSRFLFLHRWRELPVGVNREGLQKLGFSTRMWTANADGSDLYVVDPYGKTSHFVWRDPKHICAWAWHPSHRDRFYLYEDRTKNVSGVGIDVMTQNGHNTYLPNTNNDWILNDTYPDKSRIQRPYLYQVSTGKQVVLAELHSPEGYRGEFRCDTHPCASRSGRLVSVDSPHTGSGRQISVIDVSRIVSPR